MGCKLGRELRSHRRSLGRKDSGARLGVRDVADATGSARRNPGWSAIRRASGSLFARTRRTSGFVRDVRYRGTSRLAHDYWNWCTWRCTRGDGPEPGGTNRADGGRTTRNLAESKAWRERVETSVASRWSPAGVNKKSYIVGIEGGCRGEASTFVPFAR